MKDRETAYTARGADKWRPRPTASTGESGGMGGFQGGFCCTCSGLVGGLYAAKITCFQFSLVVLDP